MAPDDIYLFQNIRLKNWRDSNEIHEYELYISMLLEQWQNYRGLSQGGQSLAERGPLVTVGDPLAETQKKS